MIETMIFDMDGILIDSEPLHMQVNLQYFRSIGAPVSEEFYKREFVGTPPVSMLKRLKQEFCLTPSIRQLTDESQQYMLSAFKTTELEPMPGIIPLLERCSEERITLAVGSSSCIELIEHVTEAIGIQHYFSHLVSGAHIERGKPFPDIFLTAAGRCGSDPADCLVVEDSTNGIRAAAAAGMLCASLRDPEGHQDSELADITLEDFSPAQCDRLFSFIHDQQRGRD